MHEDEAHRIVPQSLWESVRAKRQAARRSWPGGKGKRGFSRKQGSRQRRYPTHLLSGGMVCGACGATIAQVSGKGGGYYGCLGAVKGACENRMLVRRSLTERIILAAVQGRLSSAASLRQVLERVGREVGRLYADIPETIRLRETELAAEERRLGNFVDFIGEGRGSRELGKALVTERRVENLRAELEGLRRGRDKVFQAPPIEWVEERLGDLQKLLECRTVKSAKLLRKLLGPIRLEPQKVDIGRSYYLARTTIDTLVLMEEPPAGDGPEGGSNSLRWWTRRESLGTSASSSSPRSAPQTPRTNRVGLPGTSSRRSGRSCTGSSGLSPARVTAGP